MLILVINSGSSSLKFQLLDPKTEEVLVRGLCDRIALDGRIIYKNLREGKVLELDTRLRSHESAMREVLDLLVSNENGVISKLSEISAVGHRVVHGGETFNRAVLVDESVKRDIRELIPLAPLHNAANLKTLETCEQVMPNTPMVTVFDTAFHQTLPDYAYMYALPYEYYEKFSVRRYGFHGTSHKYVSEEAARFLGKNLEDLRMITCHLGNGSSLAAIRNGQSIDTSMGLTPSAGVPMGTRCGDIDASIINYLTNQDDKITAEKLATDINKRSGVLGISGVSSDFRDLRNEMLKGNKRAELAINHFAYSVKKYIGAYIAAMGGVDAIVFTAGISENASWVIAEILKDLETLGIIIDDDRNANVKGNTIISADESPVKILVVPTNEELEIAKETYKLVKELGY